MVFYLILFTFWCFSEKVCIGLYTILNSATGRNFYPKKRKSPKFIFKTPSSYFDIINVCRNELTKNLEKTKENAVSMVTGDGLIDVKSATGRKISVWFEIFTQLLGAEHYKIIMFLMPIGPTFMIIINIFKMTFKFWLIKNFYLTRRDGNSIKRDGTENLRLSWNFHKASLNDGNIMDGCNIKIIDTLEKMAEIAVSMVTGEN